MWWGSSTHQNPASLTSLYKFNSMLTFVWHIHCVSTTKRNKNLSVCPSIRRQSVHGHVASISKPTTGWIFVVWAIRPAIFERKEMEQKWQQKEHAFFQFITFSPMRPRDPKETKTPNESKLKTNWLKSFTKIRFNLSWCFEFWGDPMEPSNHILKVINDCLSTFVFDYLMIFFPKFQILLYTCAIWGNQNPRLSGKRDTVTVEKVGIRRVRIEHIGSIFDLLLFNVFGGSFYALAIFSENTISKRFFYIYDSFSSKSVIAVLCVLLIQICYTM